LQGSQNLLKGKIVWLPGLEGSHERLDLSLNSIGAKKQLVFFFDRVAHVSTVYHTWYAKRQKQKQSFSQHRSAQGQLHLAKIRARAALVSTRTC
jgi:hypothetical protein